MTTIIYGVIQEYGLNYKRCSEVYAHNEKVINSLPSSEDWPPLLRQMFSIAEGNVQIEYWGRTIHFAASTKSIEYEWLEWKEKFESLLERLCWVEAHVHFKTEYSDVVSFKWRVDLKKWSIGQGEIKPIRKEYWEFTDVDKWEEQ